MSKFQLTLLIIFGAFIVLAVALFSFYKGSSTAQANVVVWGTLSSTDFATFADAAALNTKTLQYTYVEKREESLDSEYTEALATGRAPDLIILPASYVYKDRTKILPIPYASVSQGDYQNTFIDEANIFLGSQGIYALPLMVDPLVMYWNKDAFSAAGLSTPPAYWDEIYATASKLTEKDQAGNLVKSAIALGETKNIPHAKDVLSLLMIQAGSPITTFDPTVGLQSALGQNQGLPINPTAAAVDFYTQFSDPTKAYYSWNRSLLPAQSSFLVGDSAIYIGYASELKTLRAKSPTLSIGVTPVPQSRTRSGVTYGKLYGIAVSRGSQNSVAAMQAALALVSNASQAKLSAITDLPPIRRDLLSVKQNDQASQAFYTAAVQSRGWIDPDAAATEAIFSSLIDSVTSGRAHTNDAVNEADNALQAVISNSK